uniref:Uncharacterized protein n=1 Tax=Solanum tuberosum TaxID=4113 RepID=M1CTN1_SOLTU
MQLQKASLPHKEARDKASPLTRYVGLVRFVFWFCSPLSRAKSRAISARCPGLMFFLLTIGQKFCKLADSLHCKVEKLPTVYLGFPLGAKSTDKRMCKNVIQKSEKKISAL